MAQKRRKSIVELSQDRLPPALNQAVGNIELIISTEEAGPLLHVRATRARWEIVCQWGKALTLMLGLFKLLKWWA